MWAKTVVQLERKRCFSIENLLGNNSLFLRFVCIILSFNFKGKIVEEGTVISLKV